MHIISKDPADNARIATVYCDDIGAWDALAALTAFETTPGANCGIGDSGLADIAAAVSDMQPEGSAAKEIAAMELIVPAGSPRCRIYFKMARGQAAFCDALESVGAARVRDNEPNAIFILAAVAREMASNIKS